MAEINLDDYADFVLAKDGVILRSKKPADGEAIPAFPGSRRLCLETPLYSIVKYDKERDARAIEELRNGDFHLDCFCPHCRQTSTFRTLGDKLTDAVGELKKMGQPEVGRRAGCGLDIRPWPIREALGLPA